MSASFIDVILATADEFREGNRAKALLGEATELLEAALGQGAIYSEDFPFVVDVPGTSGWLDTGAISTYRDIGDWLVQNAGWERHPTGKPGSRRQWYRPPQGKESES